MDMDNALDGNGRRDEVCIKFCLFLAEKWGLSDPTLMALLGTEDQALFDQWRDGNMEGLSEPTLMRVSYLIGIYVDLRIIFSNSNNDAGWFTRRNEHFEGNSPLDHILENGVDGMQYVRRYLSNWIAGA